MIQKEEVHFVCNLPGLFLRFALCRLSPENFKLFSGAYLSTTVKEKNMLVTFRWVPPGATYNPRAGESMHCFADDRGGKNMYFTVTLRVLLFWGSRGVYRVVYVFVKAVCFSQYFDCVVAPWPQQN